MKKLAMRAWIMLMVLVLGTASVACGESGAAEAYTDSTGAESSYAGSGDASSGAAEAHTPNTDAEASYAGTGGAGSASGYASTPDTVAETSVTGTGSSSSSSSYSSTTTTTTTTTSTSSSSSSSSSSSAGSAGSWDALPWPPAPPAQKHHSSGSSVQVDSIVKSEDVTGKGWTIISRVNVRSLASTKASLVRQISSASTEVTVTSEVLNSAGEKWYGVRLYSGYVGYIRADLLRVELDKKEEAPAATAAPAASNQPAVGAGNHRIIYVIVEPVEEETEEEPEIIYLTPEQAVEMGLLDGTDLAVDDEDGGMPING